MPALSTALLCLALNVYHEARGETYKGQIAVANVTMNRARQQNKDVCEVVTAYKQFSWLNASFVPIKDKKHKVTGQRLSPDWMEKNQPRDKEAWLTSVIVARLAYYGLVADNTFGSTFYHADYVAPKWAKEKRYVRTVGRHLFYRKKKKKTGTLNSSRGTYKVIV